jgi:dipeptidyl-peptidase-4
MAVPYRAVVPFLALLVSGTASAQDPAKLTLPWVLARGQTLAHSPPTVLWLPGGHEATVVLTDGAGAQTLHRLVDGKVQDEVVVAATTLRTALGLPAGDAAQFPPLAWHDATTLRIELPTAVKHWTLGAERATTVLEWQPSAADDAPGHVVAPGDGAVCYRKDHQLWLQQQNGRLRQLTFDGSPDVVHGGAAHRAEFGITRGIFWSDDGRFVAWTCEDQRAIESYPYQDLTTSPPRPVAGRYPMAGRAHARVRVAVCDTRDFAIRWLQADPDEDVYQTNLAFAPNDGVVVARVNRGQDRLELVRYDATTGKRVATLLEEHDPEWVEPLHPATFLGDGRFLWWTTRSGHRHLWLHGADGGNAVQVTKGAFDVQRLLAVAADGSRVWFEASGEDPRQLHLFGATLDGADCRQLTRDRGTHHATLSPDRQQAAVTWSNLETRPGSYVLDLATSAPTPLPAAPDPFAGMALPTQRLFQIKADDDTVLYGHLLLPPDLAEGQRCPLLLYVYGGPQVQLVTDRWMGGASPWLQAFAAQGYVVCRLDNRGTPNRGIDFEQVVHRRLGMLEVLDQLRAVAWCRQQPFVDPARVGVHGWSYGGYLTLRLLLGAPEVFMCGVSGAPVTDWAMYETGYTERYMDMPAENVEGYANASCLPFVDRLQDPLLLVHGTDDRTVMWSHTLAFVDRCIEHGKQIEYFPYPMQKHGLVGKDRVHFLTSMQSFFARHLRPHERLVEKPAAKEEPKAPAPEKVEKEEGGGR